MDGRASKDPAKATRAARARNRRPPAADGADEADMPGVQLGAATAASGRDPAKPLTTGSILGLQKLAGNEAVAEFVGGSPEPTRVQRDAVVQRDDDFEPSVTRTPDMELTYLGDDITADVQVTNARRAAGGTAFLWQWTQVDENLAAPKPTPGATSARTKLHATAKHVGDTKLTPQLERTKPDGTRTSHPTDPLAVGIIPPEIRYQPLLLEGPRAPKVSRDPDAVKMVVGDSFSVEADFIGVDDPQQFDVHMLAMLLSVGGSGGGITVGDVQWPKPTTARVEVTATAPGRSSFSFSPMVPGAENLPQYDRTITAVADPEFFKGRCGTAETTLNTLHAAGRAWFMDCFKEYKAGYDAHKAVLDSVSAREKLERDILINVIFGVVGGLAGGAIGGAVAPVLEGALTKGVASAALTDAAKDLTKAVARIPGPLLSASAGHGGHGAPGTATGALPGQSGAQGRGERAAAALDPLDWMPTIDGMIASERADSGASLTAMQEAADRAMLQATPYEFDFDPVAVVIDAATIAGNPIDNLPAPPSAAEYEATFWEAWLSEYAYKEFQGEVEDNVPKELKERLKGIIKQLKEKGVQVPAEVDEWIRTYGKKSHEKAEQEAAEYVPPDPPML